ncbi:hypothetical protein OG411_29720 [Streptomyces pseudogriseolus]|uniref:hypothetical protein n=1 Tax=Streptomyces pseudogriseolus TaxID=36817 RepID=UPI003247722E
MSTSSQTPTLDQIAATGNAPDLKSGERPVDNRIVCADGFTLSVIAGAGYYSTPRPALLSGLPDGLVSNAPRDYPGPYTSVEVGFPSARPEPWAAWAERAEDDGDPTGTVYGYVPVQMVRELILSHGGESSPEGGAR